MMDEIDAGFARTDTRVQDRYINVATLLGPNNHLSPEMRQIITTSLETFLTSTSHIEV
jgi:hypothetical protein